MSYSIRFHIALFCFLSALPAFADDILTDEELNQITLEEFVLSTYTGENTSTDMNFIPGRECDGQLKCFFKNAPHISLSVKCKVSEGNRDVCTAACPTFYQASSSVSYDLERTEGSCDWVTSTPSGGCDR